MPTLKNKKHEPHKTIEELESELHLWVAEGCPKKKMDYKPIDPRQCGSGRKIGRNYPEDYFG